jgi:hypothetical protein
MLLYTLAKNSCERPGEDALLAGMSVEKANAAGCYCKGEKIGDFGSKVKL